MTPEFLDVDDVLEIHASQIAEHGGLEGLRDRGLLESAEAQPTAQFGGHFLHRDIFEMAAAPYAAKPQWPRLALEMRAPIRIMDLFLKN